MPDAEDDSKAPMWDGSILTMHKWLEDLRPYLYKKDDDYSTLVERGYIMHAMLSFIDLCLPGRVTRQTQRRFLLNLWSEI